MAGMKGVLRRVGDLSAGQLAAWRELASGALEPNPLFEPDCVVPAARFLQGGDNIAIVTAEDDRGTMHGCMPVRPTVRWPPASVPTLTTDVRRMTYIGTPLLSPSRGAEAARAMVRAMAASRTTVGCRLAELRWLHAGPVDRLLRDALEELGLAFTVTESFERPFVSRRSDGGYFDFNSRYRGVLRRRRRQLGEAIGGEVAVHDRAETARALDALIDLESRGYKASEGIALTTVPGEPEQFRAMARAFAADGRLQLLSLEGNGRPAAMQLAIRGGEGVFALKVAYDEELARFGPGVALQVASIEHFHHGSDAAWIDSCTYQGNDLIERLYPDRRPIVSYLVALGGAPERALLIALPHLRSVRRRAHQGRARLDRARGVLRCAIDHPPAGAGVRATM